MNHRVLNYGAPTVLVAACIFAPTIASAGIPECNGIRLEGAAHCEVKGDLECTGGCEELVFEQACATKLHTVCRDTCTLDPEPSCTDECTEGCTQSCDLGLNVICSHNCFGECVGSCDATCADADDPGQCTASCEATCDGECDIQCGQIVEGSCYEHCIECCGGSCGAQANMTCQTQCQEEEFTACEYDFRADCSASCSGSGALFCDGQYVASGPELDQCVDKLIALGLAEVQAVNDWVEDTQDWAGGTSNGAGACAVGDRQGAGLGAAFLALLIGGLRRRRR